MHLARQGYKFFSFFCVLTSFMFPDNSVYRLLKAKHAFFCTLFDLSLFLNKDAIDIIRHI